jgi:hypothetical protein
MEPKNNRLSIPIQMIEFAVKKKLLRHMALYIYLKIYSDGKVQITNELSILLKQQLKIRDKRTLDKYLNKLQAINWIGHNTQSGYYFIRSFDNIRSAFQFKKRQASEFISKDITRFSSYAVGALISAAINGQKMYRMFAERKHRAAVNNRDAAFQPGVSSKRPRINYYGLSNELIAEILGCKKTRACQLKKKAAADGFIQAISHYHDVATIGKADYNLRAHYCDGAPEMKGRIRFIAAEIKGEPVVKVVEQLYDEIVPKIRLKSICKLKPSLKKSA